jgi:hypothetical protein
LEVWSYQRGEENRQVQYWSTLSALDSLLNVYVRFQTSILYVDGSIGQCIKILSRCKIISRQVKISYRKKTKQKKHTHTKKNHVIAYLDFRYYLI